MSSSIVFVTSNLKKLTERKPSEIRLISAMMGFALLIRIGLALSHQFLHEWDERYHALVAKNLLKHPLVPTLYDTPLFPYDFKEWAFNHIWLSKPILPLWIISFSIKMGGLSEFAVRFPSILFSTGSVLLTYLIARQLFGYRVGLAACFLHAIHGLSLEVAAGSFSADHVDTIFLFWMELGFWQILQYSVFQHHQKSNTVNAALIGLWFGLAFMSKWTSAFLIGMVWMVLIPVNHRGSIKKVIGDLCLAALVAGLVISPWIWFILTKFPEEASYILRGVIAPINEVVQGHTGEWYFYITKSLSVFGQLVFLPMLFLGWKCFKIYSSSRASERTGVLLIAAWIFISLLALSLASTKRINYLLPLAPAFFILTAYFALQVLPEMREKAMFKWLFSLVGVALFILPIRYFIERVNLFLHVDPHPAWVQRIKSLTENQQLNQPGVVIFNEPHAIEAMFYTHCTAYNWRPSNAQIEMLKAQNLKVLVLEEAAYSEY